MFNFHTHSPNGNAIINIDQLENFKAENNYLYSVGNHPWNKVESIALLKKFIGDNPQIIAIGESGIDKLKSPYQLKNQIDHLKLQIELSEQLELPLILHIVKAYNEIIQLKKEMNPKQKWIIHGFNSFKQLNPLIASGFYLSFGQALTYNTKLQTAFKSTPLDMIFLETDDSDLEIEKLYTFAADLKEITTEKLTLQIKENFKIITNGKLVRTT